MPFRAILGRTRELADLEAALEHAIAGRGSVFLLSGEAGIGKTRIADEAARMAADRGGVAFWGRAWEVEGAPACWPWIQVLDACAQTPAGAAFMAKDPRAHELSPLFTQRDSTLGSNNPELEALRRSTAIVALLQRLAAEAPVVLLFDDLHAADLASLSMLEAVARNLRGLRVLVIGTYREFEARRIPKTSALLTRLAREGSLRPLGRLDAAAVTQWLAGTFGAAPEPSLAAAVFMATEGNPLFVEALSQLLASRGHGASLAPGFALPDTIRETVHELLGRVPAGMREVLDAAAVLGRECPLTVLQLLCEKPVEYVLGAVEEGIAAGVLNAQAAPSSPVRFAHILIRETIYQELSAPRRVELHAAAARALARVHSGNLDAHLAELAHHHFEGGPLGSWLEASDFSSRAGKMAMGLFAFDDAANHFERALAALDRAESSDDARRAELLWRLGFSRIHLGQAEAGRETCEQSAALSFRIGDGALHARAALASGSEPGFGRADSRLAELLETALQLGTGSDALRARVMARLATAMTSTSTRENHQRPQELAREAIAMARALGDRYVLAEVLASARGAFGAGDDLDDRIALDRELAVLAESLGDKLLELRAHNRLALDAIERGDSAMVEMELRTQRQLADETRIPQQRLSAACLRLVWATLLGDPAAIALAEQEVQELPERVEGVAGSIVIESNRYVRAAVLGEIAGQIAAAEATAALLADIPPSARLRPLWHAAAFAPTPGRHDEARAQMRQVAPKGPQIELGPTVFAWVTPLCIHLGEREWMRTAYESLLPLAPANTVLMTRFFALGPVTYYLGCLAEALGYRERAKVHFRDAIALCERVGFIDFGARSRSALDALPAADLRDTRAGELRRADTPPWQSHLSERVLARVGTAVRQYRIERVIGVGGMAAVYAATDAEGRRVAVKFLLERFRDDPKICDLFRREAAIANQVGHPGAVPVLAHDIDEEGCAFLIMPLLEGQTLRARWEHANKRLPPAEVAVLMADVLDVLASAHARGIVHRDIKPENLFVTATGHACVLDFGIARRLDGEGTATITGHMIGTPAFMPPEQALGDRDAIGPRSDCWAIGATIFTLLSGELVHVADNAQAQLAAAATRRARSLRHVVPNLPVPIVAFVDKALAFDGADRWQSAREMREALLTAFGDALGKPVLTLAPRIRAGLVDDYAREVEATLT